MRFTIVAMALALVATAESVSAGESGSRSVGICKSVNALPDKAGLADLSEEDLKEKMCLSSLSVVRSADPAASMQCRLAYQALSSEFSRRHPRKEMAEVYGRC